MTSPQCDASTVPTKSPTAKRMKRPGTSQSVNPGKDKPIYEPQEGESGVSAGNPAQESDAIGRDDVAAGGDDETGAAGDGDEETDDAGGDDETGAASGEDEETDDAGVGFDDMYNIETTCEIAP